MTTQIVILAAGQGKRMRSSLPKVLQPLAGKPLIEHILATAFAISKQSPIIIYGHQGDMLRRSLSHHAITWVHQAEQLGTGHALAQAVPHLKDVDQVLVLSGDVPFIQKDTLKKLLANTNKEMLGMLTALVPNAKGYGRIKRNIDKQLIGIVEEKDATDAEREIREINTGIYLFPAQQLKAWLPQLKNNNAQGEYYLTDVISLALQEKMNIATQQPANLQEILGVNDCADLAKLERMHQEAAAEKLLAKGVKILDPKRFDVRGEVEIGKDVIIDVGVIFEGRVVIGDGCYIGPYSILRDTVLGTNVEIKAHSVIEGAEVAAHSIVGPFARLRPGTVLHEHVHVGNFVEIKNSVLGAKTKANHLAYIGDSEVGSAANIGAGTITCNYDGINKHKTIIGDRVQVGSNSTLVAPVEIGADAYVAAATTVRKEVPAGSLVYNRKEEIVRPNWIKK